MNFLRAAPMRLIAAALITTALVNPEVTFDENTATVNFPTSIDFHLKATGSDVSIYDAEIAYHTDGLTCEEDSTVAQPDEFEGGKFASADWTWELRQTGAIPPGTKISWKWILQTAENDGTPHTFESPDSSVTLEDTTYTWKQQDSDALLMQWYSGDEAFATSLREAGQSALDRLERFFGIKMPDQIRVYTYNSSQDMQNSTFYAPSWSGGLAFPQYNALLLAVSPEEVEWGRRAIGHELTHVVVGHYAFSCLNSTPTWFDEGFAMVMEGEPEPVSEQTLTDAIRNDTLLSVRQLGTIFSAQPELAGQAYAQSRSLVQYLIDTYGSDKIKLLLDEFKQGRSTDSALQTIYGLDRDSLEAAWRKSVGAQPMKEPATNPEAAFTPFPTIQPIAEPPEAHEEIRPTPDFITAEEGSAAGGGYSDILRRYSSFIGIGVIGLVCVGLLGFAAIAGALIWATRPRQAAIPIRDHRPSGLDDPGSGGEQ